MSTSPFRIPILSTNTQAPASPGTTSAAEESALAIRIHRLRVRYGQHLAVDDLSLDVRRGELFGFLGPNGAGKTTTIRTLTGMLRYESGRVEVAGHALPDQLHHAKRRFGYVPDTENHYEEYSGRENLRLYARLYDVPLAEVERWLVLLELSEAADVKVSGYSKGMKKKLLLAREMLHDPQVLFCDEPTANLDRHSVALVRQLLQARVRQGMTVFLTTHDMTEVEEICDRVAILSRGRLLECDTPVAFITRHAQRTIDSQYDRDGAQIRESHDMDSDAGRQRLSAILLHEHMVRLHSREFRFEDVFRKLTGEDYL